MAEKLYQFHWDGYRGSAVFGLFIADEEVIAHNLGKEVYFGEIAGKHSEVAGTLDSTDLTVLEVSEDTLADLKRANNGNTNLSGYNPLDYIEEEEEEE